MKREKNVVDGRKSKYLISSNTKNIFIYIQIDHRKIIITIEDQEI